MKQHLLLASIVATVVALGTTSACAAPSPGKPMNVLLLIVDDLNTWLLEDPTRYSRKVK